jgi:uncharacterized protein involved in type VI secretion and phage assembly
MTITDALPLEMLLHSRASSGLGGRWFGVYPALVSDIKDPDGVGRVKVTLPWSPDSGGERYEAWARVATLMGGNQRGSWFIPDVNDEVLVVFEGGDVRRPYVIGGLWNGSDAPPETMDGAGNNDKKVLKSRNGVVVTLDDTDGQEQFIAETPGGQKVTLRDGPGSIELADSNGNSVKLDSSGITINASMNVTINASMLNVTASMVSVSAGMSSFSGTLQANTVISPSIVGSSYTPGAGNIW